MAEPLAVEVVLALPGGQVVKALTVPAGTTALQAVVLAGVTIPADAALGVFARRVEPGHVLAAGDRVEIYRPLLADPMDARRRRARRG
jgi:putative ubiquitin-RnfH superfamily antitoxin RatB of RatAB toxin-antitoxin module